MGAATERSSLGPRERGELMSLLRDSVENGASVGYLSPVDDANLRAYWQGVAREL